VNFNFTIFCFFFTGLNVVFDHRRVDDSDAAVTGIVTLTELYYASFKNFDSYPIARDVLVILWLRLIQAATHTFSSRIYADLKLKYQV